jgi:hypothetical protein
MIPQNQSELILPYSFLTESQVFKTKFEMVVLDAIDESLSTFGITANQAIYSFLEHIYGFKKNEIPFKIEAFIEAIEEIFGSGAKLIEIGVMKALHTKVSDFRYVPKKDEIEFVDFLSELQFFLNAKA